MLNEKLVLEFKKIVTIADLSLLVLKSHLINNILQIEERKITTSHFSSPDFQLRFFFT